jgi:hypothetical protein
VGHRAMSEMCGGHSANTDCQVKKSHAGSLSGTAGLSKECKVTVVAWAQLPALEKVKLYKARHLVEMTVARQPDHTKTNVSICLDVVTVKRAS